MDVSKADALAAEQISALRVISSCCLKDTDLRSQACLANDEFKFERRWWSVGLATAGQLDGDTQKDQKPKFWRFCHR